MTNHLHKKNLIKVIFNRELVINSIIPIIIFSYFNKLNMTLDGIILSGSWSICVIIFNFIKLNKLNILAVITFILTLICLIGSIISSDPTFYLLAPIIQDILVAIMFLLSLFLKKSLIQIIVEQTYSSYISNEFKSNPNYKKIWQILTVAWGMLNLSQALLRSILLHSVSTNSYYTLSTLYSNISTPILIIISIIFPKWYLKRNKTKIQAS